MSENVVPDLASLCADLAAELDDVAGSSEGETIAYARNGVEFARIAGSVLRVRLPVDIADAARNTPDTALDPDDRGWLVFSPTTDERHVTDRATAWFRLAHRHAEDN